MAEYIEREALLAAYDAAHEGAPGGARKLIEEAPTIDAVPVCRCRDCKHGRVFGSKKLSVDCPYHDDHMVDLDHFCSYGERKDGE